MVDLHCDHFIFHPSGVCRMIEGFYKKKSPKLNFFFECGFVVGRSILGTKTLNPYSSSKSGGLLPSFSCHQQRGKGKAMETLFIKRNKYRTALLPWAWLVGRRKEENNNSNEH